MPICRLLTCLLAAAVSPVVAYQGNNAGATPVPIPSLPMDFDDSISGAHNSVTSVALVPDRDYYVYVDSVAGGGAFHPFVWVFIGVELQTFDID